MSGVGSNVGGYSGSEDVIVACFWDKETSGQLTSFGGTGRNTIAMKTKSNFTDAGWNFVTIWNIDEVTNNGYPFLRGLIAVPTVTTQAVTDIHILYALGNGNLTATGGEYADLLGICWKETSGPTVADNKVEYSGTFDTRAFANWITPTLPKTLYYVKAYAHNSGGYGYGNEVTFTSYALGGYIWIETDKFHYIDEIGDEQDLINFDQDLNTTDSVQFSELLLTPKASSTGAEGTIYYDSDDNHVHGKVA